MGSALRHAVLLVFAAMLVVALPETASSAKGSKSSKKKSRSGKYSKTSDKVAGGSHWRIKTPRGPVHVWIPPSYDRATAGIVVYVHGFRSSADRAWKGHKLAQQFRASRQNALFIVPGAPASNKARIRWGALGDLKKAVRRGGVRLPDGPAIVIGHSGAFRTIAKWLDNRLLAEVILLDALYAENRRFAEFIHSGKRAKHHKLIIVAAGTAKNSRKFARQFKYAAVKNRLPEDFSGFTRHERRSKLLYVHSQYSHNAIVTGGKVIPLILRLTPLRRL